MTSTDESGRAWLVGGSPALREQLAEGLERAIERGFPDRAQPGDVVFLDAATAAVPDDSPWGNAFTACLAIKQEPRIRVFLLIREADGYSPEIARFCMADGCVTVGNDGSLTDLEELGRRAARKRTRPSIDALLDSLERKISENAERQGPALERMLNATREDSLLEQLTDPETGLFDGPFAAFKLDEEFKRAMRLHQPLSLVLFDCGVEEWPADPDARRIALAEFASTFLNECRDIDVLARFTEKVFLFLLPGTGPGGAEALARRILRVARERPSIAALGAAPAAGLITIPMPGVDDRSMFLERAEDCLRRARRGEGDGSLCSAAHDA